MIWTTGALCSAEKFDKKVGELTDKLEKEVGEKLTSALKEKLGADKIQRVTVYYSEYVEEEEPGKYVNTGNYYVALNIWQYENKEEINAKEHTAKVNCDKAVIDAAKEAFAKIYGSLD